MYLKTHTFKLTLQLIAITLINYYSYLTLAFDLGWSRLFIDFLV